MIPARQIAAKIEPVNCFCRFGFPVDAEEVNVDAARIIRPINERLMYDSERRSLDVLKNRFKIRIAPLNL